MESERWSIEVKHTLRHGPLSQFFSALTSLFRRFGLAYLKGKDISPKYSPNFFGVKREIKAKRSVKKPAHRRYAVRLDAAKRFYPDETPGAAAACAPPPPHAREHRRCNCCCAAASRRGETPLPRRNARRCNRARAAADASRPGTSALQPLLRCCIKTPKKMRCSRACTAAT